MMKTFILREEQHVQALQAFIEQNWQTRAGSGSPLVCVVREERTRRSSDQNRYYWTAVLQQIAAQAWVEGRQYPAEVWHECAKRKFLGQVKLPGGGHMADSTTTLSTQAFADYVQNVEEWAALELGVSFTERAEPAGRVA